MDSASRSAADRPLRSASETVGPHLLGRIYTPDLRDWSLARLMEIAEPPESLLDRTVSQVLADTSYFSDWQSYLVMWRWLKAHQSAADPDQPDQPAQPDQPDQPDQPATDSTPGWTLDTQLDQGQTNHCVGFGWSGWVDSLPVVGHYQNADGHALYYECKVIDGAPHAENGSNVRSGALALRNRGRLAAFAFAKTTSEIDSWINTKGPVVVGTTWTEDMFNPDADGFVKPTGGSAGGHCYVMLERRDDEDAYVFQNSWGKGWGQDGRFKIKTADFDSLLQDQGEACCSAELSH
jgi:Papain family cysteine protease